MTQGNGKSKFKTRLLRPEKPDGDTPWTFFTSQSLRFQPISRPP